MTADLFDRASDAEQAFRDNAIKRQLDRVVEQPRTDSAGSRCCLDCSDPIPQARLVAVPHAVRCFGCQAIKEPR
ncbi:TraR/DksA family transcriptional regulator [Rheinheimera faecalis]|uniref:TraR/DksA family transcriptional regulator n=1 Tax=Rheinheimera faecalis TaxID=2901141 RepID=UPI001E29F84C|nr:TraR/DksA family transcriptional regulator [Rheinheimera faecalis]